MGRWKLVEIDGQHVRLCRKRGRSFRGTEIYETAAESPKEGEWNKSLSRHLLFNQNCRILRDVPDTEAVAVILRVGR